jgi:hypothetical protein
MRQENGAFGALVSFFSVSGCQTGSIRRYAFGTNRRREIAYFDHWGTGPGYYKHQVGGRLFFIRKYKETLKQVDRPKTNAALFRHPSEKGWNLSEVHKRHFLKFLIGTFRLWNFE